VSSVSYVGALSSAGPNGGTQTFNLTLPSGCAAGDFAVVTGNMDGLISNGDGMSISGGVTLLPATSFGSDGETSCIIGKFLTSTDITNGYVTVTKTGPYSSGFTGFVARGVNTTTPLYVGSTWNKDDTASTNPTATGTSIPVPAGGLAIWACFLDISGSDGGFINTPSAWTLAKLAQEIYATQAVCYDLFASAGSTGAVSAATASSDQVAWAVWMGALQPPSSGGALAGNANLSIAATATASGQGALAGSASLALAAAGTLKGGGALAGVASLGVAATATLKGAGALLGAAALAISATGVPSGAGALSGNAGMALSATATPSASGALAGNASLTITATGTAAGPSGSISGSAPLAINVTGTLAGSGALSGSAGLAFASSGTLNGSGALAGTAPFTITAVARPNGSSALAGSANLAFAATGTLQGLAPIAGSANLAFTASAIPTATAAMSGAANLAFASTGALTGTGLLAGQGSMAFTAQGTPSAQASIAGVAGMVFTATGTLTDGLPSLPADALYYVQMPPRAFYAAMPARSFYILSNPNMTTAFSNLDPRETEVLTFDASNDLADGETLTNIESVAISVQSGPPTSTLPTLSGQIINGSPVTLTVNGKTITIPTGCCVQVVGSGGVTGTQYLIAITCNTSNPDKVLTLKGILPVSAQ
jgi:hypothetical protein